jgi:hypothetical protein
MQHHSSARRRRRLSACGEPLQAVQFSLDADVAEYLRTLGDGNPTAGLHEMLQMYKRIPAALRDELMAAY